MTKTFTHVVLLLLFSLPTAASPQVGTIFGISPSDLAGHHTTLTIAGNFDQIYLSASLILGPSYDTTSPSVGGSSYGKDQVGPGYGADAGYAFRPLVNIVVPLTVGGYIYQEGNVLSPLGNGGSNRATNLTGKFELAAGVGFLYLIGFETGAYALGADYNTFRGIGLNVGLYY